MKQTFSGEQSKLREVQLKELKTKKKKGEKNRDNLIHEVGGALAKHKRTLRLRVGGF